MSKYLSTPERDEQKGRVEDGPINLKAKFTEWPQMGDAGSTGSKTKATGKVGKTSYKAVSKASTGAKSSGVGRTSGGSKSAGSSGAKGK